MKNTMLKKTAALCLAAALLGTGFSAMAAEPVKGLMAIELNVSGDVVPQDGSVLDENDKILDGEYHAKLDLSSLKETDEGMEVNATLYVPDKYSTDAVHSLKEGDTIICDGKEVTVNKIEDDGYCVLINGGFDYDGITLFPTDGGAYIPREANDYPTFEDAAEGTIVIGRNTVLSDKRDIHTKDFKEYKGNAEIKEFFDTKPTLTLYNTFLTFKNGELTGIRLIYTP